MWSVLGVHYRDWLGSSMAPCSITSQGLPWGVDDECILRLERAAKSLASTAIADDNSARCHLEAEGARRGRVMRSFEIECFDIHKQSQKVVRHSSGRAHDQSARHYGEQALPLSDTSLGCRLLYKCSACCEMERRETLDTL